METIRWLFNKQSALFSPNFQQRNSKCLYERKLELKFIYPNNNVKLGPVDYSF